MPLIIPTVTISEDDPSPGVAAPTLQGQGINVQSYKGGSYVAFQFFGLVNLDDYSLEFYGTLDDNDPATGDTTYPTATTRPHMDTLSRTKTGSFIINVPVGALGRLYPRVSAWTRTLGIESTIKYSARVVDGG